jgi:hypothetical protein
MPHQGLVHFRVSDHNDLHARKQCQETVCMKAFHINAAAGLSTIVCTRQIQVDGLDCIVHELTGQPLRAIVAGSVGLLRCCL